MTASKPAHPPGWDPSMAKPVAAAPMSKTAKKNEARKKKRDAEAAAAALTSGEDGPDVVGDVPAAGDDSSSAAALASLSLAAEGGVKPGLIARLNDTPQLGGAAGCPAGQGAQLLPQASFGAPPCPEDGSRPLGEAEGPGRSIVAGQSSWGRGLDLGGWGTARRMAAAGTPERPGGRRITHPRVAR